MGDGGLGMGDWELGIGPNPQSPIPNPQSPIPIGNLKNISLYLYFQISRLKNKYNKIKINQWEIKMIHL